MRARFSSVTGCVCLAGLCAFALRGQPFAQVSGQITDIAGGAVEGAGVSVWNEETGLRRLSISRVDGGYVVASLQPGVYKVTVRKEGFRTVVHFGVRLSQVQPARVDFILPLGSVQETVTVEGEPEALSTGEASGGVVVRRDQIERLPARGRGLLNLLELAAGTVVTPATRGEAGQFTANGQRPNSHYFTVDGVSVNSGVSGGGLPAQATGGALPGMTAFGSLHDLVSLDALDEFRARTSVTAPEYGRLPGVQVALTSRSGSNRLHGSWSHYFRHEKLDANDWFANRRGAGRVPLRLNDFGLTLGGPVRRDRTFFFLSYEGLRLRQPFNWRSPVPAQSARQTAPDWLRPVLSLFPAPNGPALDPLVAEWTAHFSRPARLDAGSVRLDHALTPRISLFGRYQQAPSSSEFGGWQINQLELESRSFTLGLSARLTPHLVEEFRMNTAFAAAGSLWRQADGRVLPACYLQPVTRALTLGGSICESFFRFSIAGIGQLSSGSEGRNWQHQWNLVEMLSLDRGRHQFRLGADYRRLSPARRNPGASLHILSEGIADLLADRNLWISVSTTDRASSLLEELSFFGQDTWRATERLSLTYGIRWELNPPPLSSLPVFGLEQDASPFAPPDPSDTPIWPLRYNNLAPRAGAAYRLGRDTVLRAGFGLYFDSSLSVATDLVNGGPLNVSQFVNPASQSTGLARLIMGYGFLPDLRLPLVRQWSASIERAFANRDVLSVGYAGSAGGDLLRREMGGPGSNQRVRLVMATNHGSSAYHALQAQYRRRMARRVQALASYSWSHSIDTGSADSALHWAGSGLVADLDRGSSDFDVRHAATAAVTWSLPGKASGWSMDGILHARTGFPIQVLNAEHNLGVNLANAFRPDRVAGEVLWMVDPAAPGGRRLNRSAFHVRPGLAQGNLGRNAIAGFGMLQLDLALQREWALRERRSLLVRVEALNAMNHANLADPLGILASPLFGESPSMLNLMLGTGSPGSGLSPALQIGGARSVQLAFRFRF
ncbi:MAG: TonB-dependent receptor [Acidobacteria bacterium]|nr:TonB-dependent receptor [Acidobacteriota bacterium]